MMRTFTRMSLGLVLLGVSSPLWSQTDPSAATGSAGTSETTANGPMVAPAPVSGEGYSMEFASETPRTNYLRGGLIFGTAYDDDVVSVSSQAASDVSYSISPTISFDQTRSRFRWNLSYSPGFTFYQKYSSLNQSNQNVATKFSYRLSPHVTFSAQEAFSKSLGGYVGPCEIGTGGSCGALQSPNTSIVAPATDTLNDSSSAQITYQFSPGGMVGVTGNFSELRYPDQGDVPGLHGSSATGGSAYYTHRLSGKHYIGATYQYQKYLTHSDGVVTLVGPATLTQSLMLFYTLYLQRSLSLSVFGGPQYSDTYGGLCTLPGCTALMVPPVRSWSPGGGGSFNWQGQRNAAIANFARKISDGGGLQGAVTFTSADASVHHRFSPVFSGTVGADYSVNKVLAAGASDGNGGHSISGTVTLQRTFGEHFNATLGYLRLHQSYDIQAISSVPNRNRVWFSIGYQFERALGR